MGKRVVGFPALPRGGLAEQTILRADELLAVPDDMPVPSSSSIAITYQTGWVGLYRRGELKSGETLLVHGAAGGVGTAAIQLGVARGARVIATARGEERLRLCRELGAEVAVGFFSTEDFVAAVNEATGGRGADVVYDPVGGDVFGWTRRCIAFEGRILVVGFASGRIPEVRANHLLLRNFSAVGVYWGLYRKKMPEVIPEAHAELLELYRTGAIDPVIQRVVPFEHAADAVSELAARRVTGKIVVRVSRALQPPAAR